MLDLLLLALVLSAFGGTVQHLLVAKVGATQAASDRFATHPLRRALPTGTGDEPEDEASGPSWASFPRAF